LSQFYQTMLGDKKQKLEHFDSSQSIFPLSTEDNQKNNRGWKVCLRSVGNVAFHYYR
jgi:hypothetical protein